MKAYSFTLLSCMSFVVQEIQTFRTSCGNVTLAQSLKNYFAPPYKDVFSENLLECVSACSWDAECGTLTYMEATRRCYLLSNAVSNYPATNVAPPDGMKTYMVLGLCQSDYVFIGGKCLKISSSAHSFVQARESCTADGAELVQITTWRILMEIQRYLQYHGPFGHYWVGATGSAMDGAWRWTDGSTVSPLCHLQSHYDTHHCLSLIFSDVSCYNIHGCMAHFGFICQKPGPKGQVGREGLPHQKGMDLILVCELGTKRENASSETSIHVHFRGRQLP